MSPQVYIFKLTYNNDEGKDIVETDDTDSNKEDEDITDYEQIEISVEETFINIKINILM